MQSFALHYILFLVRKFINTLAFLLAAGFLILTGYADVGQV